MPRRASRHTRGRPSRAAKNRKVRQLWARTFGMLSFAGLGTRLLRFAPRLGKIAICAGIFAGGVLGYQWLIHSDRFHLAQVEVRGNERVSDEQIIASLNLNKHAKNMFQLRVGELAAEIERNPWIEQATMTRSLPNQLLIEIKEHQPKALVHLDGLYLVDRDAYIFKRASIAKGEGLGLAVITGIDRKRFQSHPHQAREQIARCLAALDLFRAGVRRPTIGELHVNAEGGLTLMTRNTATAVRLGDISDLKHAAERLAAFDAAWATLTPAEQTAAHTVYVTHNMKTDRVAVGFRHRRTIN